MSIIARHIEVKGFPIRFLHTYMYLWRTNNMSEIYVRSTRVGAGSAGVTLTSGSFKAVMIPGGTAIEVVIHPTRNAVNDMINIVGPTGTNGAIYPIHCDSIRVLTAGLSAYGLM